MHPYVVADVFTSQPLKGNPVAVFTAGQDVPESLMQDIAREMNLSETVFVLPSTVADAKVRIFTPTIELPFAGHPVLGTAYVLGQSTPSTAITLETGSGVVPVELTRQDDGQITLGRMSQPVPTWREFADAGELLAALGVRYSVLPVEIYDNGARHLYVMLDNFDVVAALKPNLSVLAGLPQVGVSCFAGSGTTWKTRMFGPSVGVMEDPATGSAAGPLAVHLVRHGKVAFGTEIEISQGAELKRPSTLYARVSGAGANVTAVEVAGAAVITAHGQLAL